MLYFYCVLPDSIELYTLMWTRTSFSVKIYVFYLIKNKLGSHICSKIISGSQASSMISVVEEVVLRGTRDRRRLYPATLS